MTRAAAAVGLAAVLGLVAPSPAPASGVIRVAIVENARAIEARGTDVEITELGLCLP